MNAKKFYMKVASVHTPFTKKKVTKKQRRAKRKTQRMARRKNR